MHSKLPYLEQHLISVSEVALCSLVMTPGSKMSDSLKNSLESSQHIKEMTSRFARKSFVAFGSYFLPVAEQLDRPSSAGWLLQITRSAS
jgi:hypothetical protein